MKKILSIALVSLLACGALLAGCGGEKKADPKAAGDKTKVAFVYVSSAKDGGYSMAHELGRQYVEKNMPNVQASYIESVPEGAARSKDQGSPQPAASGWTWKQAAPAAAGG